MTKFQRLKQLREAMAVLAESSEQAESESNNEVEKTNGVNLSNIEVANVVENSDHCKPMLPDNNLSMTKTEEISSASTPIDLEEKEDDDDLECVMIEHNDVIIPVCRIPMRWHTFVRDDHENLELTIANSFEPILPIAIIDFENANLIEKFEKMDKDMNEFYDKHYYFQTGKVPLKFLQEESSGLVVAWYANGFRRAEVLHISFRKCSLTSSTEGNTENESNDLKKKSNENGIRKSKKTKDIHTIFKERVRIKCRLVDLNIVRYFCYIEIFMMSEEFVKLPPRIIPLKLDQLHYYSKKEAFATTLKKLQEQKLKMTMKIVSRRLQTVTLHSPMYPDSRFPLGINGYIFKQILNDTQDNCLPKQGQFRRNAYIGRAKEDGEICIYFASPTYDHITALLQLMNDDKQESVGILHTSVVYLAPFQGKYYRAKISQVSNKPKPDNFQVKVHFMDYGNYSQVSKNEIMEANKIHPFLSIIPAQAITAHMFTVKKIINPVKLVDKYDGCHFCVYTYKAAANPEVDISEVILFYSKSSRKYSPPDVRKLSYAQRVLDIPNYLLAIPSERQLLQSANKKSEEEEALCIGIFTRCEQDSLTTAYYAKSYPYLYSDELNDDYYLPRNKKEEKEDIEKNLMYSLVEKLKVKGVIELDPEIKFPVEINYQQFQYKIDHYINTKYYQLKYYKI